MRIDVAFTPAEAKGAIGRRVVVVIDVLRATTTIAEALSSGATSVLPVASVDDAVRKADQIGRDAVLLCGERDAQPIRGFSLGNSPLEFVPDRVSGKTLVMTTTNGTRAILAAAGAEHCLMGSLTNLRAVADRIMEHDEDVLLLCAGREGAFALEDAYCAGRIATLLRGHGRVRGNDGLRAALHLARRGPASAGLLARTAAGRRLREIGREDDIEFCAVEDRHEVVPLLDGARIKLQVTGSA